MSSSWLPSPLPSSQRVHGNDYGNGGSNDDNHRYDGGDANKRRRTTTNNNNHHHYAGRYNQGGGAGGGAEPDRQYSNPHHDDYYSPQGGHGRRQQAGGNRHWRQQPQQQRNGWPVSRGGGRGGRNNGNRNAEESHGRPHHRQQRNQQQQQNQQQRGQQQQQQQQRRPGNNMSGWGSRWGGDGCAGGAGGGAAVKQEPMMEDEETRNNQVQGMVLEVYQQNNNEAMVNDNNGNIPNEFVGLVVEDRKAKLGKLALKQRVAALLDRGMDQFPLVQRIDDYENRVKRAVVETKAWVLERCREEAEQRAGAKREALELQAEEEGGEEGESDDDDGSGSGYSGASSRTDPRVLDTFPRLSTDEVAAEKADKYTDFIDCLPYCAPLDAGFEVAGGCADDWCYCPLGRYMRTWRATFDLEGDAPECEKGSKNAKSKPYQPFGLIKHLETKWEGDGIGRCVWHGIVLYYLRQVYKDYWSPGKDHKALYDVGSKPYKDVEAIEKRRDLETKRSLQVQLDEEREQNARLREDKKSFEELRKVCKDMARRLKQKNELESKLRQKLKLSADGRSKKPRAALSDEQTKRYSRKTIRQFALWHKAYRTTTEGASDKRIQIKIDADERSDFVLQEWFDKFGGVKVDEKRTKKGREFARFLFGDELDEGDRAKLLRAWEVTFSAEQLLGEVEEERPSRTGRKKRKKDLKDLEAVDEGGPTRAFLSELWAQVGALVVVRDGKDKNDKNNQCRLFRQVRDSLAFPEDDYLRQKLGESGPAMERAKRYYRAIGRMILYSLGNHQQNEESEGKDRTPVADHVLLPVYRRYLLQDVAPESSEEQYPVEDLLVHFLDSIDEVESKEDNKKDHDEVVTTVDDRLSEATNRLEVAGYFDSDDGRDSDPEERFRRYTQGYLITNCSIALNSVKEGLTLNGMIDASAAFSGLPVEALNKLFFAKAKINVEDIICALEPFHADVTDDVMKSQCAVLSEDGDKKEAAVGILPDILRARSEDPEFLRKFVFFATGHKYIPQQDFQIIVEFSEEIVSEGLPVAHTCEKTLKLPMGAYGGNRKLLEEKLDLSLANTAFSMT